MAAVWSVRGFVVGFRVELGGVLKDPCRGGDLWSGWLQDRIWAGCLPAKEGITEVAPNRVSARQRSSRMLVYLGAGRLALCGQVADPGRRLGEFLVRGRM
jgi:hypothetical protein